MLQKYKNIHMIGIGGIGMSGIAKMLLNNGYNVSGCDVTENNMIKTLKNMGAGIFLGHSPAHIIEDTDLVVRSSAVELNNAELEKARALDVPIWQRARLLSEFVREKYCIAVTGTHGKTTVSFMLTHILKKAGLEPGFIIGGEDLGLGGNAVLGNGRHIVLEADESDGTQVFFKPDVAVITNIDRDHMEYYKTELKQIEMMKKFTRRIAKGGVVIGCGDDTCIRKVLNNEKIKFISYGLDDCNDFRADNIQFTKWGSSFDVIKKDCFFGKFTLNVPGLHNIINALGALASADLLGVESKYLMSGLSGYYGTKRRLEIILQNSEITVIDDYAHHPSEIRAVLNALCNNGRQGRLIGVFQPHRFTRTQLLGKDIAQSFNNLDLLILTDIYGASEKKIPGVTGRIIYDEVVRRGIPEQAYYLNMENIKEFIKKHIRKHDTVIFMGAGDITKISHQLTKEI